MTRPISDQVVQAPRGSRLGKLLGLAVAISGLVCAFSAYSAYQTWEHPMGDGCILTDLVHERFANSPLAHDSVELLKKDPRLSRLINQQPRIEPSNGGFGASGRYWEFGPVGDVEWIYRFEVNSIKVNVHVYGSKRFSSWHIDNHIIEITK
ncbi:hypothetical protein [Geothrix sp. PMB-07]|uniref:hypothetical protein n=1 Tax=Geothrix sp. PMB-07 TaxID=3068640 RepID=UPI0027417A75|nr:hypothetical protein [Geothrix sp. PMB-07]WLT32746.1 hypothetical protein Q9293_05285 [Geothrix sp. PMB-07]